MGKTSPQGRIIAVDSETTGLDLFHNAAPFMVCTLDEYGAYKTWQWAVDPYTRQVLYDDSVQDLADYLQGNTLVFHHADFDLRALSRAGIQLHTKYFSVPYNRVNNWSRWVRIEAFHDTQLLSHVVNSQGTGDSESELGRHALKPLALHYLDISEGDEGELRKATAQARRMGKKLGFKLGVSLSGEKQVAADYWLPKHLYDYSGTPGTGFLDHVPSEWDDLCEYYCKSDCYRTIGLFFFLQEILRKEGLDEHYAKELRLLPVTFLMEHFGLHAARSGVEQMLANLQEDAKSYKEDAESILSKLLNLETINVNSSQQLANALVDCGFDLSERTAPSKSHPTGQWKTDATTLRKLAQCSEVPGAPSKLRKAGTALRLMVGYHPDNGDSVEAPLPGYKTFQTGAGYVRGYLAALDGLSRLHPSFAQVGTAWTRYSCSEPNGQNISAKSVLPLRKLFGPPPGYVWFAIDYSQLELRIFAAAAKDKNLLNAFEGGFDFHTQTAVQLYNLPPEKINKEQRRIAKNVNFGIIFGAGPAKIDATTGRPGTYSLYLSKFPDARKFMARVTKDVENTGFVRTLSGYRLRVPDEKPYAGVNAIVQGTAGIVVKNAMIEIHEQGLVDWSPPSTELPYGGSAIVANIHDELVIQIPESYPYPELGRKIMAVMEEAGSRLGVVTPVDAKLITTNWTEGKNFK